MNKDRIKNRRLFRESPDNSLRSHDVKKHRKDADFKRGKKKVHFENSKVRVLSAATRRCIEGQKKMTNYLDGQSNIKNNAEPKTNWVQRHAV